MADSAMKSEVKPEIKLDGGSPSNLDNIEAFEDDHDLYIPPHDPKHPTPVWLVKVSQEMWKAWNDLYANAPAGQGPLEVGKLRAYNQKPGEAHQKVQIRLNDAHPQHRPLPKVYNLDIKNAGHKNTVVFSEKDLPGHRSAPFGSTRALPAKPTGIPSKTDRYAPKKPGQYRTAIPKQTALAPPIAHEAVANPVDDDSSIEHFKNTYTAALNGANKATFSDSVRGISWHPGSNAPNIVFGTMTSKPGKGRGNKKEVKDKAVRMEKVELLDAIQNCFREYSYWSSKALRNRLHQPEAYIKETLEEIAVLVKSGDFVSTYKLKPDYQRLNEMQAGSIKDEMAPVKDEDSADGSGDEGFDDDDEMGFEDVDMKS